MSDTPATPINPAPATPPPVAPAAAPAPAPAVPVAKGGWTLNLSDLPSLAVTGLKAIFSPVISLVKARSWWVYLLFGLLAYFMVSIRGELKASLLSNVITLGTCYFGYIIAKILSPEISIADLLRIITDKPAVTLLAEPQPDTASPPDWPDKTACAIVIVAAIGQRVVYGALCFMGAIYMIPSIADKIR